jgi:hypothetical protein
MSSTNWCEHQLDQLQGILSLPDDELAKQVNLRAMLRCFHSALIRLRSAERFCIAARTLAQYKRPLEHVLDALDGWERIVGNPEE